MSLLVRISSIDGPMASLLFVVECLSYCEQGAINVHCMAVYTGFSGDLSIETAVVDWTLSQVLALC